MHVRMEREAFAIALKDPDLRKVRFSNYLLVAAFGFNLVLRLLNTVPQLLSGAPIALADIAWIIAFSIFLFGAAYSLTPRSWRAFQMAYLSNRNKWYQKSRAERIRTVCLLVLAALSVGVLPVFALGFVEMVRSPGQDLGTYLVGATPFAVLIVAVSVLATVIWASRKNQHGLATGNRY